MDRGTARALSRGERPDRGRGARGGSVPYRRLVVLGAGRARAARGGGIRGRRQRVRRRPRAHAGGGALPVERSVLAPGRRPPQALPRVAVRGTGPARGAALGARAPPPVADRERPTPPAFLPAPRGGGGARSPPRRRGVVGAASPRGHA